VYGLTFGTETSKLLSAVPLSVLNYTICFVWSVFRYLKVHILDLGQSDFTEIYTIHPAVCLSVL